MGRLARAVFGLQQGPAQPAEHVVRVKKRAYEIRAVNDIPYFKELLQQLEDVSQQPVSVGVHADMIEQVGKQNAYREILSTLRKDLKTAERMIAEDQARQRKS
jgi:hypothetical protein